MSQPKSTEQHNFFYPRHHYYGHVKPENLVFNANLQEFAQAVSYISSLETTGKLTPEQAFQRIQTLWHELELSKQGLKISTDAAET